jgi:hypothetical protein
MSVPDDSSVEVEEAIDRLYGLPVENFTGARNEAAARLRKAGRREDADQIKALRKPTAVAAAVNRLVREHRREVAEFLAAAGALRDAQFSGRGDLSAATQRERRALDRLVKLAGDATRQTLQAAAVDDAAAEELLRGRLERQLEPRGFGTLLVHATPQARPRNAAPPKPDDREARARVRDAKETLAAARAEERQARRRWEQTQTDLERAEGAVAKAQEELARVQRRR